MKNILIFGHKNPDTDSICSTLALSKLKELQGYSVIPCRLGNLNKETEFVLNHFAVEAPTFINSVSPQLCDIKGVENNNYQPKENDIAFSYDEFIKDVTNKIENLSQELFPITKDGKIVGSFNKEQLKNVKKEVILVDHNEFSQTIDDIKEATIIHVVDHHKFGNFETSEPLRIDAEPVGCSSTIVYRLYKDAGIQPPKTIAGLMLSAILSDTLLFKSPTCTERDIEAVKELAKIAEIEDFEKYGMDMLIAGTSLSDKTPEEILTMDQKEFDMNGIKMAISQVNTVDIDGVLKIQKELEDVMNKTNLNKGYKLSLLVITDIVKAGSILLSVGEGKYVEKAFNTTLENNRAWAEGVVSRKKQVVPFLMMATAEV